MSLLFPVIGGIMGGVSAALIGTGHWEIGVALFIGWVIGMFFGAYAERTQKEKREANGRTP